MKRNNVGGSEKRKAFVLRLRTQTIDSVKAGGALRASGSRTLGILKNLVVGTGIFAVASLSSFWPWQTEREESLEKGNLQPMHSDPSASLDSLPKAPGDASASKSAYTYTCFGLWADSKTGPTPSVQQRRIYLPARRTRHRQARCLRRRRMIKSQLVRAKASEPWTQQALGPCKKTLRE
jgi:hypothetical protein